MTKSPIFSLSAQEPQDLLGDFLAHAGRADALVAGGADLLAMRDSYAGQIGTADELAQQMHPRGQTGPP